MKTALILLLLSTFLVYGGEDEALASMVGSAANIVEVEVLGSQPGGSNELYCDHYVLCRITKTYKGDVKKDEIIRIHLRLFAYKIKEDKGPLVEQNRLVEGKNSVLFLGKISHGVKVKFENDDAPKPTYSLSDRWLGIMAPSDYLAAWFQEKIAKKDEPKDKDK